MSMTTNNSVIMADCFVIPNKGIVANRFNVDRFNKCFPQQAIAGDSNTKLIQIWTCGSGSDNWSDHGGPKSLPNDRLWPTYFPLSWFEDRKENDIIEFQLGDTIVQLCCKQLCYRYRDFGPFEKVVDRVK